MTENMNPDQGNKYARRILLCTVAFFGAAIISFLFIFSSDEASEQHSHQERFSSDYRIYSLTLPSELYFAGEKVPLHRMDVREQLDRELLINTYWQSNTLIYIKKANRWFPLIEPILKKNNVPDDFKYLALIESGLSNVVSPSGAAGFWQILKDTGKEYGLMVNQEIDERYHLEKSTEAACLYLLKAYQKFGKNWTVAAASYNGGMAGIEKQLKRQQTTSYYDLVLNEETARYVFRIIAAKEILENQEKYGFHVKADHCYPPVKTYEISTDTTIDDLALFAYQNGINYKILKFLNPWLRDNYLPNRERKAFVIKLPADKRMLGIDSVEYMEMADTLHTQDTIPSTEEDSVR